MTTHKGYRIFSALIYLSLMFALNIGNVQTRPAFQTEIAFAALDDYVTEQMNDLGIPGLALGIVENSQITHLQGFGIADSSGRAVTPQTPFHIGSVTKSFTALAVMQLVEAGKIDLDAPVQNHLPWFKLADKQASTKITVRHLLNNTSGISRIDGDTDMLSQQGLEEKVRGLVIIQLTQPVGSTFQYSNINWSIAGLIVEQVSGQSYADYVTEHIFNPLDMRHSYASRTLALADGLVDEHHIMFGHAFKSERPVPPAYLPAGFLIASIEDMTHYAIAQLNEGRYGKTFILSPQRVVEMHTPAIPAWADLYYGMGWEMGALDGIPIISHTGDDGSNHSMVVLMPSRGSGIVLLTNASGFEQNPQINQIAEGVANLLNGETSVPVSAPISYRFLYWIILLMPLLMVFGIAYTWRHSRNKRTGHTLVVVLLYGGSALLWLFGVPLAIGQPILTGMRFFNPELAYGLITGAAIGIGWSVIYTVMSLKAQRLK